MKLHMHSPIDPTRLSLLGQGFLCHLGYREEGLDIVVFIFIYALTVIVNLNLVSKVKGGQFS